MLRVQECKPFLVEVSISRPIQGLKGARMWKSPGVSHLEQGKGQGLGVECGGKARVSTVEKGEGE